MHLFRHSGKPLCRKSPGMAAIIPAIPGDNDLYGNINMKAIVLPFTPYQKL